MFARLGTNYEIRNQCFFAILETMTTDFGENDYRLFVRRNQIIIDLVLIHKVKKIESFQFFSFLGGFCLIYR